MRVLGVITARGGSKGLPGKNLRSFHGHPLLAWTVRQSVMSTRISKTLVSTDDPAMAEVARRYGADCPFLRPAELSNDTATSLDVVAHALEYLRSRGEFFDAVLLLQPTSPLRLPGDLDSMLEALEHKQQDCDAVIAVAPMKPSPALAMELDGERLNPAQGFDSGHRQGQRNYYSSYGLGWAVKISTLENEKTFYPARSHAWKARRGQAVDIDDLYDFAAAEAYFSALAVQGINLCEAYMKGQS